MNDDRIIKIVMGNYSLSIVEFQRLLVAELSSVTFKSKLFSRVGTVDQTELEQQIMAATARVIQSIRDIL